MSSGALSGSADFTITGTFTWTGGRMSGLGRTIVTPGAVLLIVGDSPCTLGLDRTLENPGDMFWVGAGGGVLAGSGTINNSGSFAKTDASTVTLNVVFNCYGTLDVQGGTVQLGAGGVVSDTFTISTDSTVRFSGGTFALAGAITTAGTLVFSGADV